MPSLKIPAWVVIIAVAVYLSTAQPAEMSQILSGLSHVAASASAWLSRMAASM